MLERSDKVSLIVAAVLVVVLAAGSGALLWKRADTLAKESPSAGEADVKLTPIASPEVVPAAEETAPVEPKEQEPPKQPKGAELGYVKRVKVSGSTVSVTYDPAALLLGNEAELYAKSHGMAAAGGWLVANDTHKLKTLRLAKDVQIVVAASDGSVSETMTADAFRKAVASDPGDPALKKAAFWFVKDGSRISRVEQLPES